MPGLFQNSKKLSFLSNVPDLEAGHDGEAGHLQPPKIPAYTKINFSTELLHNQVKRDRNKIGEALMSFK